MYLAFDFLLSSQPLHLFLVRRLCLIWFKQLFLLTNINIVIFSESLYYIFQPCVGYFSLLLKEQCVSWLFWTKYFKKKFNLQLFYLPTVLQTLLLSWATKRYPPPWNFLFRKNNCICNRYNARGVAAYPDEKSTKRSDPTNQVQIKIKLRQFLERI